MPCNAIVYLPATIRQLDTTAMFANSADPPPWPCQNARSNPRRPGQQ